jgi:hypothetical protein
MVDESMGRFISSYGLYNVEKGSVWGQTPVVNGNGRRWLVMPLGNAARLELGDTSGASKPSENNPIQIFTSKLTR